jgi:PAS domain S-box-containing protein
MNTSEALAQARGQLWITIGFVTALLFGAGATLINVWRRQSIAFYQERNRAAASLRESERFLRETQWVAGLGTYDLDLQTGRWKSSEILDNIFGIDETFVRSVEGWATLIHPDDREMMMDYFTKEVLGNHQRFDKEYRIIRKNDGAERWVHGLGRLQLNAEGQPIMMIGTIQGITARKQMDEELKSSEALYHDLVATSQDLIWQCDAEENYIYLNPAWETVFGYKVEEMLGKKFTDFQRPTDVARDMKEFTRLLSGGTVKGFESTHIGKDGQDIHLVFNAKVVTDKHGKVIGTSGTAYDITERIKAEEALRASESFIKKILETVGEGIVVIDQSYKILSANKAYLDLTNTHPETVLGKCCYGISHHLSKPCDEAGEDCPLRRTLDTGESHDAIHTHYDEKGAKRIVEIRTYPMKDESGKVISAIEVINDITDKHKLEDQLRQAQKMESIGTLAGGIAHDFNNILTAIVGYGHIVLMKMAKDDPLRVNIEHMLEAGDRAAHLTKSLLLFSRKQISERKPVDLNEIIRTVENFLKRVIGEDVECTAALFEEALPILGDAHQLEQVLMNLATNARDAMSTGGIFAITTEQVRFDEEFITIHGYGKPGIYGSITLSDTGTGMDAVTREHIFEPFFTTKDAEKGTGLGLAIVYGIIKQHEGFINVYSEPGQGTSFKIYLPLIALGADEEKKITEERPVGGAETILLAEDDETVRNMTKAVLEDVGYHVITANDGQDAVNKYKENKDMVRLLLFDLIMPKRTGKEAYDEIKAMTPAVKVLFASGYAPDMVRHKVLLDDDMPVVYKPISPTELLKQVRASLDR